MGILTLNGESVEKLMDDVGWNILQELQTDARISYSELGRRVGLSSPAVTERVRRMEEAGIIKSNRDAYLGHGPRTVGDLYTMGELPGQLEGDAVRLRDYFGDPPALLRAGG